MFSMTETERSYLNSSFQFITQKDLVVCLLWMLIPRGFTGDMHLQLLQRMCMSAQWNLLWQCRPNKSVDISKQLHMNEMDTHKQINNLIIPLAGASCTNPMKVSKKVNGAKKEKFLYCVYSGNVYMFSFTEK